MVRCFWLVGTLLLSAPAARAQPFDWLPVNRESAMLLRAGRHEEASAIIERSLQSCPQAVNPAEAGLCRSIFLENRSEVQERRGDLVAAEASLKAFIEARTAVLPSSHPLVLNAYDFLAQFYMRHGRRAEEAEARSKREALSRDAGPMRGTDFAVSLYLHSQALQALGRLAEGIPLLTEALATASRIEPPGSQNRLAILLALVKALTLSGSTETAVAMVLDELSRPEARGYDFSLKAQLTEWAGNKAEIPTQPALVRPLVKAVAVNLDARTDQVLVYNVLCALVRVRTLDGNPEGSMAVIPRLRTLTEAKWGPRSGEMSQVLALEAAAELKIGHPEAAVARKAESIAMLTAPETLLLRTWRTVTLSTIWDAAGRQQEARTVLADLLRSPAVTAGTSPSQAEILALLGQALAKRQAYDLSGPACDEAVRLADARPGTTLAIALWCQGSALAVEERSEPARQVALRAWRALWTGMAWDGGREPALELQRDVLSLLAGTSRAAGRLGDALDYARQQLAVSRRIGIETDIATAQSEVCSVQRWMGRWDDAMASCDEGLAALPEGKPAYRADLLSNKGLVLLATNRPAAAAELLQAAAQLSRSAGAGQDFATALAEDNLSRAHEALGRPDEAGPHLDVAIALYRTLAPLRRGYLERALMRRGPLAVRAGEPAVAEAAFRETLALQAASDPDGPKAAETRLMLAAVLENLARQGEARALRQQALASMVARYGNESLPAQRLRLASTGDGRSAGCEAEDVAAPDQLLACLTAQARLALSTGRTADATAAATRAVATAEALRGRDNSGMTGPLLLLAEAEADAGNPAAVRSLLDRAAQLRASNAAGEDKAGQAWLLAARGRLLGRAGDGDGAVAALRAALAAGTELRNPELVADAASALAAQLVASGAGGEAIALWQRVTPLLAGSPLRKAAAMEGLGDAAASLGRYGDAARFYGEGSSLRQRAEGAGSTRFRCLVIAQATMLSWGGEPDAATRALRLLEADRSPAASYIRSAARTWLAVNAGDAATALLHARQAVGEADAAFGPGSAASSQARLDRAGVQILAGERPDAAEVARAAEALRGQDPSWRTLYAIERMNGLLAATAGDFDAADAALAAAEALLAEHAGPGSLHAALAHAERANARLARGDAAGADQMFRQALAMASSGGQPRNTAWARIAVLAARAAERAGDPARAARLFGDATRILPRLQAVRHQWL